jgi:hypothetical protein
MCLDALTGSSRFANNRWGGHKGRPIARLTRVALSSPVAFGFLCETTFGLTGGTKGAFAVTGAVSWSVTVVPPALPVTTATLVKLDCTFGRVHW